MFDWFGCEKNEEKFKKKNESTTHESSYCMYAVVKIQLTNTHVSSKIDDLRVDVFVSELFLTPEEADFETSRLNDANTKEGVSYSWQSVKIHKRG